MESVTEENLIEEQSNIQDNQELIDSSFEENVDDNDGNSLEEEEIIEEDPYEYFNSTEEIYSKNISALSLMSSLKENANNRFMERKLKFAKQNSAFKIMFVTIISIATFFLGKYANNLMIQNYENMGFTLKSTSFIIKNLYIPIFLCSTSIFHLIIDLFIIFLIEILDLFMFIINRFDYHIITESRKLKNFIKGTKSNEDNNNDKGFVIIIINGILYVLVGTILIPINMLLKISGKSIATLTNEVVNSMLPQNEIFLKKQPDMDISKLKLLKNVKDKNVIKEPEQKRNIFTRLRDMIKKYLNINEYINNIKNRNDLLTNSLKEGKRTKLGKAPRVKGSKEKGKATVKGKERTRDKDNSDSKGQQQSQSREKDDINESKTKEKQVVDSKQNNSHINQQYDGEQHKKGVNDKIPQEPTITPKVPSQTNNPAEQYQSRQQQRTVNNGEEGKTKSTESTIQSPKQQPQHTNLDTNKEKQMSTDMKELHDLYTKGIVRDDNGNGVGGIYTEEQAQQIAETVRKMRGMEEDKSRDVGQENGGADLNRIKDSEREKTKQKELGQEKPALSVANDARQRMLARREAAKARTKEKQPKTVVDSFKGVNADDSDKFRSSGNSHVQKLNTSSKGATLSRNL